MEMTKILILLCFSLMMNCAFTQDLETRKHLVSATATISPGFQKDNDDINIYLHGLASFYPEPKVSIDGEVYWFLGGQEQQTKFAENSSLVFGINYHFTKDGKVDPFVGLMPGVSLVSVNNYRIQHPVASNLSLVPIVSLNAGFKFHMAKWCNAFVITKYIKGTLVDDHYKAEVLDEIRISFGLCFNLYGKDMWIKKSPEH